MKIQIFDGGLNTKLRPQFLQANQATVYENIDNDVGSLAPVKAPLQTDIALKRYHTWYDAESQWVDSDERRDYLEFQKVLYWTDRVSAPQKFDGTTQSGLGIAVPPKLTNLTENLVPAVLKDVTIVATSEVAGLPLQTQYYVLVSKKSGKISDGFYVSVSAAGRVTVLGEALTKLPNPAKVSTEATDKMAVDFSEIKGLSSNTLEIYRLYESKWYRAGTIVASGSFKDDDEDISGNIELTDDDFAPMHGVFTYVMTYYDSAKGIESGPSQVSAEQDLDQGGTIQLNSLPVSSDSQVDKKRLYRVGGDKTIFTLVDEIANSTTSYLDDNRDVDISGLLPSTIAAPAPTGLAFLTEAYAMLFGAVGDKLRFTPVGQPDSWPETYFLTYDAPITGIATVATGVLVFTKFKTHLVTGSGPTSLSTYPLSSDQGCLAFESVQQIGTEAVWVSSDGVCRSSGNRPQVMTKPLLGKIAIDAIDSVVYDEVYYVLGSDGKILALGDSIAKNFNFDILTLNVAEDKLYGYQDGKLLQLFAGTEPATFKYESPRFTEGFLTTNKSYKKIFLYSKGHVIINILINDELVQTRELNTEDSHTIQVPQELQRGFFVQFQIEGTGEVYEIEFEAPANG